MDTPPRFTATVWFVTGLALLVSLGAQVLIGALLPLSAVLGLEGVSLQPPLVLIAGETSLWRTDALIRGLSFGLGAWVACALAASLSWRLVASLVTVSAVASMFAQFPRPATAAALSLWAAAAPLGSGVVCLVCRAWARRH